jgi:type III polyketide synthase
MIATITKDVPKAALSAISPMFEQIRDLSNTSKNPRPLVQPEALEFDWALHPGGAAILQGAKQALHITDDHIRASLDVYQHYGNSSSPTILIVLDKLGRMGEGRDNVVATSFGPGLMIEMCMLRRCRFVAEPQSLAKGQHGKMHDFWLSLHSRLSRRVVQKGLAMTKGVN